MEALGGKTGLAVSPVPPDDDPTLPAVPDPEKLCSNGLGSMSSFEHAARKFIGPSPSIGAEASLSDLSSSAAVVMISGTLLPGAEAISSQPFTKRERAHPVRDNFTDNVHRNGSDIVQAELSTFLVDPLVSDIPMQPLPPGPRSEVSVPTVVIGECCVLWGWRGVRYLTEVLSIITTPRAEDASRVSKVADIMHRMSPRCSLTVPCTSR
jgi:hypothetical protein